MSAGYIAFEGDPLIKAAMIERFAARQAAAAGSEVHLPFGEAVEGKATIANAERSGYPTCLVRFFDVLSARSEATTEEEGWFDTFAVAWLEGTAVGADLSGVPSAIILDALADARSSFPTLVTGLAEAATSIDKLHREVANGERPDAGRWRAARSSAVIATDGAETKIDRSLGAMIEALCWDPIGSSSVLVDLARSYAQVRYDLAVAASGWTPEDQTATDGILAGFWAETAARREAGERIDFKAMFALHHHVLQRRYSFQMERGNDAYRSAWRRLGDLCLARLAAAR